MNEASKQRMEKHLEDAIERWTLGYDENTSFRVLGTELYQAGMQDPDANKKPYNIIYGDEENLYRLYCEMEKIAGDRFKKIEELQAELKAKDELLREFIDIASDVVGMEMRIYGRLSNTSGLGSSISILNAFIEKLREGKK